MADPIDRDGIVRLYHPGRMTEAELEPLVHRRHAPRGVERVTRTRRVFARDERTP